MSMYSNADEPIYEPPKPPPPLLWIGLTAFFALFCCIFFVAAGVEAVFLFGSGTGQPAAAAGKPAFGDIKFYLAQTSTGKGSGADVTNAPVNAKAVYACFAYSNMPKSGATWGYEWSKDGEPLAGQSKADQRWTKEGSGTQCVPLADDKGLKAGAYDLSLKLNGNEAQFNTLTIGQ
jgi:hypothetical protein